MPLDNVLYMWYLDMSLDKKISRLRKEVDLDGKTLAFTNST